MTGALYRPLTAFKAPAHSVTGADESAATEITNLLVRIMREGDDESLTALRQLFDFPVMSSNDAKVDPRLISTARVFINGENANRVETWISRYQKSLPHSWCRSVLEQILWNFIANRTVLEATKCSLAEASNLRTELSSKFAAMKDLMHKMYESLTRM